MTRLTGADNSISGEHMVRFCGSYATPVGGHAVRMRFKHPLFFPGVVEIVLFPLFALITTVSCQAEEPI